MALPLSSRVVAVLSAGLATLPAASKVFKLDKTVEDDWGSWNAPVANSKVPRRKGEKRRNKANRWT